jgi:hypothetical protein
MLSYGIEQYHCAFFVSGLSLPLPTFVCCALCSNHSEWVGYHCHLSNGPSTGPPKLTFSLDVG